MFDVCFKVLQQLKKKQTKKEEREQMWQILIFVQSMVDYGVILLFYFYTLDFFTVQEQCMFSGFERLMTLIT